MDDARERAHAAGLPFSEQLFDPETEFDPYVYDGSMTAADYKLMHRDREQAEREEMRTMLKQGTANPNTVNVAVELDTTQAHAALDAIYTRIVETCRQADALADKLSLSQRQAFIQVQALQDVLDAQITRWRKRKNERPVIDNIITSGHYIDAYQYIRELFIGARLPE